MRPVPSIVAGFLLFLSSPAWAATVCFDESRYPSVAWLQRTPTGMRAFLDGEFFTDEGSQSRGKQRRTLKYSEDRGWQSDQPFTCAKASGCIPNVNRPAPVIPPITLSKADAIALRPELQDAQEIEQKADAWTEYGGMIWFGISFYAGEGTSGAGGLGRYDPKTGNVVIRRPKRILDSSIDHIVHDGQWLWLATAHHYECLGVPPAHGLVRYDWSADRFETFEGQNDGPCGFVVHDLFLDQRYLWVATELGISRWDRRTRQWDYYVPDPAASPPMRPTTCATLYTRLLKTLPRTLQEPASFYSQLFSPLKRFRPQFLLNYTKAMPRAEWQCDELQFLAEQVSGFRMLKAELLRFHPPGSQYFMCVLNGFGERKSRDLEWRDLLIKVLNAPAKEPSGETVFNVLPLLEPFSGDPKIIETLIATLDRFQDPIATAFVIEALVRSTRIAIAPNGVIVRIPLDADPERYAREASMLRDEAIPQVAALWKRWWQSRKTGPEK